MGGFSLILVLFVLGAAVFGLGTFAAGHFIGRSEKTRKLGTALRIVSYFLLIPIFAFGIMMFIISKLT